MFEIKQGWSSTHHLGPEHSVSAADTRGLPRPRPGARRAARAHGPGAPRPEQLRVAPHAVFTPVDITDMSMQISSSVLAPVISRHKSGGLQGRLTVDAAQAALVEDVVLSLDL